MHHGTASLIKLAYAVGSGFPCVQHHGGCPGTDRLVHLGGARHHSTGLAGQSETAESRFRQQLVNQRAKIRLRRYTFFQRPRKSLRLTASSTRRRSALTQHPLPGRFRFRSGTTEPSGPATNRIKTSAEPLSRVTIQVLSFISCSTRTPVLPHRGLPAHRTQRGRCTRAKAPPQPVRAPWVLINAQRTLQTDESKHRAFRKSQPIFRVDAQDGHHRPRKPNWPINPDERRPFFRTQLREPHSLRLK